jgi:hypothetical protein
VAIRAADAGANLRELMDRMGHSTNRAAMVYLHGSNERQHAIADELSSQAAEHLGRSAAKPSDATGTAAPDRIVTAGPILGKIMAELGVQSSAPTATRTRDLLLRRQSQKRRLASPDVPFCHNENGRAGIELGLGERAGSGRVCRGFYAVASAVRSKVVPTLFWMNAAGSRRAIACVAFQPVQ